MFVYLHSKFYLITHKEAVIEQFKKEAHKIFATNSLWLPEGVKVIVDENKYNAYKKGLENKVMAINAPDIDDKTKKDVINSLLGDLDAFINKFR